MLGVRKQRLPISVRDAEAEIDLQSITLRFANPPTELGTQIRATLVSPNLGARV